MEKLNQVDGEACVDAEEQGQLMRPHRFDMLLLWSTAVLVAVAGPLARASLGGAAPAGTPPPGTGMMVTGILGGSARVAIIRAEGQTIIAGVGERVGDAVVVSILSNKVVLKKGTVTFELPVGDKH